MAACPRIHTKGTQGATYKKTSLFVIFDENTVFYEGLGRSAGVGVLTECKHSVLAEGLKHDDKVGGFLSEKSVFCVKNLDFV